MRHRAGVHQRGGGIAVFVAEIRADQLPLLVGDAAAVQPVRRRDLVVTGHEHAPRLPVARLEVLEHQLELVARLLRRHVHDLADEPLRPADAVGVGDPANMERSDHHARRIGVKTEPVVEELQGPAS
jgi:hypothetical protein